MRWLALLFVALIAAIQYPIWFGKGGWLQVRELERQVAAQRTANAALKSRNDRIDADVRDLKAGFEAVEERARSELGMVRHDEVFFQLHEGPVPREPSKAAPAKATEPPASAQQHSGSIHPTASH